MGGTFERADPSEINVEDVHLLIWQHPSETALAEIPGDGWWVDPATTAHSAHALRRYLSGRWRPVGWRILLRMKDGRRLYVDNVARPNGDDPETVNRCHANRDGDCSHADCPQLRDGEPAATGRHCPLDVGCPRCLRALDDCNC